MSNWWFRARLDATVYNVASSFVRFVAASQAGILSSLLTFPVYPLPVALFPLRLPPLDHLAQQRLEWHGCSLFPEKKITCLFLSLARALYLGNSGTLTFRFCTRRVGIAGCCSREEVRERSESRLLCAGWFGRVCVPNKMRASGGTHTQELGDCYCSGTPILLPVAQEASCGLWLISED